MTNIHNIDHEYDLNNKKLEESDQVSEQNKQAISRFSDKCFAEGLSKSRVRRYLSSFHTILKMAPDSFELYEAEKEDLEGVVARIEQSEYAEATKCSLKITIKKFYKVIEGEGREYPDKVGFISTTRDKSKMDDPDPLSKEEIKEIINECNNDRDRAMYKVLYEAGLRAGELMSLKIKDVEFSEHGVKINIDGKTGNRKILLVESERYLRNWLTKHPFAESRDSPLWVEIKGSDIKEKNPEDVALSYDYMRINLKRKSVNAKIRITQTESNNTSSEVHPHLFRHSRATHVATDMTEAAMKEYFGWTQGSDMPEVYIYLSGRDIDREVLKMYGIKEEEKEEKKKCSRCMKEYKGSERFCPRCGAPLSQKDARKVEKLQTYGESYLEERINGLNLNEVKDMIKKV
jgi:site-specific recombinase XerD